jgi:hypothetical protein
LIRLVTRAAVDSGHCHLNPLAPYFTNSIEISRDENGLKSAEPHATLCPHAVVRTHDTLICAPRGVKTVKVGKDRFPK